MSRLPYVVVYKKSPRGRKYFITILEGIWLEDIIDSNKRKPPLPHDYEIVEIGIGKSFLKKYMEEYGITKIEEN